MLRTISFPGSRLISFVKTLCNVYEPLKRLVLQLPRRYNYVPTEQSHPFTLFLPEFSRKHSVPSFRRKIKPVSYKLRSPELVYSP